MLYKFIVVLACLIAVSGKSSSKADKKHAQESSERGFSSTVTQLDATTDDANPSSSGASQNCASITPDGVRYLFKTWGDSLLVSPEAVVENYWEHSILVPTLSNVVRADPPSKINYFEHFCAKKPVPTIVEDFIDVTACNEAQYNGLYNFALTDPVTKAQSVANARFSYTFQTFDGKVWKIKTHHSSLLPNPVGGARRLRGEIEDFEVLNFNVASYK